MRLGLWCQLGFWLLKAMVCFFVRREKWSFRWGWGPHSVPEPPLSPLPLDEIRRLFGKPSFFPGAVVTPASAAKDADIGLLVFYGRGFAGSMLKASFRF